MNVIAPHWEHFDHDADIGIRGIAPTLAQAFEQAALAMTAVITDPAQIQPVKPIEIRCSAQDPELLLFEWINELVFAMAKNDLLFGHFRVTIDNTSLTATAFGETVDRDKHQPAVEIKGATFTGLRVYQNSEGKWIVQCVVDV